MTQRLRFEQLEQFGFGPNVMRRTKLCPACGTLVTNGATQCPGCRSELPGLTLFEWYAGLHRTCTYCRTPLSSEAQYCPHCGRRVQTADKAL